MQQRSIASVIFLAVCILYYGAFLVVPQSTWQHLFRFGQGEPVEIFIEPGMTAEDVAARAGERGVVGDPEALLVQFSRMGVDKMLVPGLYLVRKGTPWEVAVQFQGAAPVASIYAVAPGMDFLDVEVVTGIPKATFEKLLASDDTFPEAVRPFLPADPESRVAFLLPGTYPVAASEDKVDVVRRAAAAWSEKFASAFAGHGADEVIQVASLAALVEKESPTAEDKPTVAGVFLNRMAAGMPLQSPASVRFAWKEQGRNARHLAYADFRIDSPFNTYVNKGLPPRPICVPSEGSWAAAIAPARHDYLYFVTGGDGKPLFSKTYGDYLASQKVAPAGK